MPMLRKAINPITALVVAFYLFLWVVPAEAALPNGTQDVYGIFLTGNGPLVQNSPYDYMGRYGGAYASWSSPDFDLTYDGGPVGTDACPGIIMESDGYPPRGAFLTYSNASTGIDSRLHWMKVAANNSTVGSFELTELIVEGAGSDTYTVNIIGTKLGGGTVETGNFSVTNLMLGSPQSLPLTNFAGQQITSFEMDFTCTSDPGRPADWTFQSFTVANVQVPIPPPAVTGISPTTGPTAGGTSVTITGTNFTGATSVTIGGNAATGVTVDSAISITATTPAGTAGAKDVVVTTLGGSGTGSGLFTYLPTYTVTYDGNTNSGGAAPVDGASPYLSGSTVTVLGAGTLTKTNYTFSGWNTLANGTGTAYAATDTFAIGADTTLNAQWTPLPTYTITANAAGTGSGSVTADSGGLGYTYPADTTGTTSAIYAGSTVVLTATADAGATVAWTTCTGTANGNGTGAATCTYTNLDDEKTAAATFTLNTYTVTATAGENGSLKTAYRSSPQTVPHNGTTSFRFGAAPGFHVASVSGCGITYNNGRNTVSLVTTTTGAISAECTVSATFAANTVPGAPVVTGFSPTNDTTPTWQWTSGGGGSGKYRRQVDSEGGVWTIVSQRSYTAPPLAEGSHTLYVQERDSAGNWSESGSFTIVINPVLTAPAAPTNLVGSFNGGTVALSWADNATNETGYRVYRRLRAATATAWGKIADLGSDSQTYDDSSRPSEGAWQYHVKAYNGAGATASDTIMVPTGSLNPPQLLSAMPALGGTQIDLLWDDSNSTETGYEVWRKTLGLPKLQNIALQGADSTGYSDTGITVGALASYFVCAVGPDAESACSQAKVVNRPAGLTQTQTDAVVKLSWTDNSTDESGFRIYRRKSTEAQWSKLADAPLDSTSWDDTEAVLNTTYEYRVAAWNAALTVYTNTIRFTTIGGQVAPDRLTAVIGTAGIDLAWRDKSTGEDGYEVWRRSEADSDWVKATNPTLAAGTNSYSDTAASDSRLYLYQVCTVTTAGGSACKGNVSANGPTGVSAIDTGAAVALGWSDNASDESGYTIYRKADGETLFSQLAVLPADAAEYTDNTALAGTNSYRICAANSLVTACAVHQVDVIR